MTEWFEEWFNTEEYLNVYRHRNEAEARLIISLILNNISLPLQANVLDMACGAGRHSILFAEKGFDVTAVDLSTNLLKVAKKEADKAGVSIRFVQTDLRHFAIEKKFHLAVNLFTSFGYFENDEENFMMVRTASGHLVENGFFVLDYFNSDHLKKKLIKRSENEIPGGKIVQTRMIKDKRVIKNISILKNGIEKRYVESVRMYHKDELIAAMHLAGLKVRNIFGGFSGQPFDLESSERIIIIAQK